MAERMDADEIVKMTELILKLVSQMEKDLDDIEIKLEGYSKSIQDVISQDAQKLVLEIREKIDSLKTEAKEKAENAKKGGKLQQETLKGRLL